MVQLSYAQYQKIKGNCFKCGGPHFLKDCKKGWIPKEDWYINKIKNEKSHLKQLP